MGWGGGGRATAKGSCCFVGTQYVGAVEMPTSLQGLREDDQSGIIREAIGLSVDAIMARKNKRSKSTAVKQYPFGAVPGVSLFRMPPPPHS